MPDIIKGYKIKIPKVTGNVSIICRATSQQSGSNVYTVTNNLVNCTNSNTATSVNEGSPYSATVTPNSGYELMNIAISIGGTNVTSTVYTYQNGNAVINIPNVTGNVVITIQATATSSGGETGGGETGGGETGGGSDPITGDVLSYMTYGKGINQTTGVITNNPECWATVNPVTVVTGKTYTISLDATWVWVYGFDEADNYTSQLVLGTNENPQNFTFTANSTKIRFGCYDPNHILTYCTLTESSSSGTSTYTVTKNLPNCTSSNTASSVNKNANYSTLISANNGYKIDSITVTMGGTDITSSVVTDE